MSRKSRSTPDVHSPKPPVARVIPKKLFAHGDVRIDNYYWFRDRGNPEVIDYLNAENDYTNAALAHTKKLREKLFDEITHRIKQSDESAPYLLNGYYYYERFVESGEYPIYCRRNGSLDSDEEILIDVNILAEGHGYCAVSTNTVSTDNRFLAFSIDTIGRRFYTIYFKNLDTGEFLEERISNVTGDMVWANDNQTLFYCKQDPLTLRSDRVYKHLLDTDQSQDELVFEETDQTFSLDILKTRSKNYILIECYQTLSTEYRYLDADTPDDSFKVFHSRENNLEYSIDHGSDRFFVRTNYRAPNFRLMETPIDATGKESWSEIIPHREDVFLSTFEAFRNHLVIQESIDGLNRFRIFPTSGAEGHVLEFGEPAYLAHLENNEEFDTPVVRYVYSSLTTPNSTYDYHMVKREKKLIKRDEVLGDFDPSVYATDRMWATARDGTKVPISILYRRSTSRDGSNPLLLYAYGSYGYSTPASFKSERLSLIDRGFVYAIAHVRGGQELGRQWYEDGKLRKKINTFTDFIDCAQFLITEGYTSPENLLAEGGSAGGLLIGAVVNMAPGLFKGVIARVPFVDVATTMFDESIPLTTREYDEWGNPNDKTFFDYMLSYSPYDHIKEQDYPDMLVTTGLQDSQVQYWEPAKWVARLRALKTDDNLLLLHTHMQAGHSGPSGRHMKHRETALIYSFMLDLVDIKQ